MVGPSSGRNLMAKDAKARSSILPGRLEAAVREYYNPLRAFFRKRTQNCSEVDDLVQQVFMRLTQHLDKDTVENPDAYIFKTASNTLRDYRRREEVRERVIDHRLGEITERDEVDSDFSPERVLISREAIDIIAATLRRLPDRTRQVYILSTFEGLKYMDIGRLQNLSVRSVKKHMAKALEALNEDMEKRHERS